MKASEREKHEQFDPVRTAEEKWYNFRATPKAGLTTYSGRTTNATASIWFGFTLGGLSYLDLDPTITIPSGVGAGQAVNQFLAHISDASATVLPFLGQLRYSPRFLYPRP